MADHKFTDDVLTEKFLAMEERFDQQLGYLGRIEKQTTTTNGRVTELEKEDIRDKAKLEVLAEFPTTIVWLQRGAWVMAGAIPLLTIWAGWLTNQTLKAPELQTTQLQTAVAAGIKDALDNYKKP